MSETYKSIHFPTFDPPDTMKIAKFTIYFDFVSPVDVYIVTSRCPKISRGKTLLKSPISVTFGHDS